jgi:hypothetical protein
MKVNIIEMIAFLWLVILLSGCTISFQNISTHGMATDLVDQDQGATADVKPNIQIPAI